MTHINKSSDVPCVVDAGAEVAEVQCPYCPAVCVGEEDMQEHISSQHASQNSEVFGCPHCSLVCTSQEELQEHLLTLHVEPQSEQRDAEEEPPSTSHTVWSSVDTFKSDRKDSATSFLKNDVTTGVTTDRQKTSALCTKVQKKY